jgi:riboflavin-specific deaminase-like protein
VRPLLPDDSPVDLRAAYGVPAGRHVRVNFATSIDGAVTIEGRSRGLSSDADRELFHLLRAMADVVLVGAGTVRAENYGGARPGDRRTPPIAVVTRSLELDLGSRLFTDTAVPPIVVTCAAAPAERLRALTSVADVVVAGDGEVDISAALDQLAERGLEQVVCEGGPQLFGALVAAAAVDELCLSVAPLVVGGITRLVAGLVTDTPLQLRLQHVLADGQHLFLRYSTEREPEHAVHIL